MNISALKAALVAKVRNILTNNSAGARWRTASLQTEQSSPTVLVVEHPISIDLCGLSFEFFFF